MKKLNLALIIASTLFMTSAFANSADCAKSDNSGRNTKKDIREAEQLAGMNKSKAPSNKRVVRSQPRTS